MTIKTYKCPECSANIKLEEDSQIMFCQFCGAQLHIDDDTRRRENKTYNYSYNYNYDEARIREADVKLLKLERDERESKSTVRLIIAVIIGLFLMVGIPIAISLYNDHAENTLQKHNEAQGLICPGSSSGYKGRDYKTVKAQFETMGFTNIELIDIGDKWFLSDDYGKVESVTINGKFFDKTDGFESDAKVIISYH